MNNSVFGKTMENVRNRVDTRLVNNVKKWNKLAKKHNFESATIFSEHLVAIHMRRTSVKLIKPIYLGMSILDISKTLLYDFHYNYINQSMGMMLNSCSQTRTPYATKLTPRISSRIYPAMSTKDSTPATTAKVIHPES